jgi:hypothetical protein
MTPVELPVPFGFVRRRRNPFVTQVTTTVELGSG